MHPVRCLSLFRKIYTMQLEAGFLVLFGLLSLGCSAPREGLPLLNPGGIGGIFEGPNEVTIIKGPDGSEITSEQKGGLIIRDDGLEAQPIVVAEPVLAPILTQEIPVSAGPIITLTEDLTSANQVIASPGAILESQATPLLTEETWAEPTSDILTGYEGASLIVPEGPLNFPEPSGISAKTIQIVQQDPHIIETEIIEAPDIEPDQSSDLQGPSGRVITRGSASIVSGPASTTITEPRKIIVAPPKIVIGTPVIAEATILPREIPLPSIASLHAGLSYSTTTGPIEYGYSTTATPLVDGLLTEDVQSTRIDLGVNDLRQSIPVVEYSSLNGVINGPAFLNGGSLSTTESYVPGNIGTAFLQKRQVPQNLVPVPRVFGIESSATSPYVQKIPRIGDSIAVDGRVDMAYPSYRKSYQLPRILGMALSRFYQKTPTQNTDIVNIDDKMGDLSQNEIISYDTRKQSPSLDLSQSQYIAPALNRNAIDTSQINLAQVPLSQVTRLADGSYHSGYDSRYLRKRSI